MSTSDDHRTPPLGPEDDRQLLARVAEGDRRAFEQLYRRYYRRLLAYLLRLLGGRVDEAEEALDDAFWVVWNRAGDFRGGSRVSSWIFGIGYRKALKRLEMRSRSERELPPEALPSRQGGSPESPAAHTDRQELAQALAVALSSLPGEQREVVELTYFRSLSYREISALTGAPVGTVKTRMFHARRRLRKLLPALGYRPQARAEEGGGKR